MTPIDQTENLLYKISRGDEKAFYLFVAGWSETLLHYASAILKSKEMADEVVSDVFLQVWKSRDKILQIEYMGQWLRTITHCKAISRLRNLKREPEFISFDEIESFTVPRVEAPDETILDHEQQQAVNDAINSLPPKCKSIFYLAKIERMPYKQIAAMYGISLSTINYHVAYAMDYLKNVLNPGAQKKSKVATI